jgi:hypothetical protein
VRHVLDAAIGTGLPHAGSRDHEPLTFVSMEACVF